MRRWSTIGAIGYFILMAVAVTFPGIAPFNSIEPLVLGLPFVFFWISLWVFGALIVFLIVHIAHSRSD